jgi:hypothetical protein
MTGAQTSSGFLGAIAMPWTIDTSAKETTIKNDLYCMLDELGEEEGEEEGEGVDYWVKIYDTSREASGYIYFDINAVHPWSTIAVWDMATV